MKFIKWFKILIFLFFLVVNTTKAQSIKVDGVTAVVGKNIVLDSDIEKFEKEIEQQSEGKASLTKCEIMDEIMSQKLISHHAVIDSVAYTTTEVDSKVEQTIAYFKQQLGSMDKVVDMYGFNNEEDLKKELFEIQKEQLLVQRKQAEIIKEVTVTPDEIRTYFNNLKKSDDLPEFSSEVEIAQIVLTLKPSEEETLRVITKLNEIKKEIEEGLSFKLKAIIHSDDPAVSGSGPGAGGKYTLTRESGFIKEFKEIAFSLDEGEVSDPFESGFGYHIVQLEKIKGQERDVRHILIQPTIFQSEKEASKSKLDSIKTQILNESITFEEAVEKYSEDKETRFNKGLILNPQTNDTRFDLTRMDPALYGRVNPLKEGEISDVFYDEVRGEEKMHKIIVLKSKTETHTADYVKDYEKIQNLALQKKQEETLKKWSEEKILDTYIKLENNYKDCSFNRNWIKQ